MTKKKLQIIMELSKSLKSLSQLKSDNKIEIELFKCIVDTSDISIKDVVDIVSHFIDIKVKIVSCKEYESIPSNFGTGVELIKTNKEYLQLFFIKSI